jgi:hypothetical protein
MEEVPCQSKERIRRKARYNDAALQQKSRNAVKLSAAGKDVSGGIGPEDICKQGSLANG